MPERLTGTILLLADLHLGDGYYQEYRLPPLDYPLLARLFGYDTKIKDFFESRCHAHNKTILRALPRYLATLLNSYRRDEGYMRYEFDLHLLLGDVVTWPNLSAYGFLVVRSGKTNTH